MKTSNSMRQENGKNLKAMLKVLAGVADPTAEPWGDWPWCGGIVHQPKHPKLMEMEAKKAEQAK